MDQTNRFTTEIVNKDAMIGMVQQLCKAVGRMLTQQEVTEFSEYVKKNSTKNWNLHTTDKIKTTLLRNWMVSKFTAPGRNTTKHATELLDVHEIMKLHIGTADQDADDSTINDVNEDGIPAAVATQGTPATADVAATAAAAATTDDESTASLGSLTSISTISTVSAVKTVSNIAAILGKGDVTGVQSIFNPKASWKKNYVIMDTRYRLTDTDGTQFFQWTFLNGSTQNAPGVVNSLGTMHNVISMKVMPIRIPYQDNLILNSYRRVTMLIQEFSAQSTIGQEGTKFHFMFETNVDGNMIELTPLPDRTCGIFEFQKPITDISTLTVSFGNPLEPVIFAPDRMLCTPVYSSPSQFICQQPHNLQTGDQVYFTDFTSNAPGVDQPIINSVNSENGHNVYVIDAYTIEIDDFDLSMLTQPITPFTLGIYFGSKRVFIDIEFSYMDTSTTSSNISM